MCKWGKNTIFVITCFRSSVLAESSDLAWCWAVVVGGCNDDRNCGPPPPPPPTSGVAVTASVWPRTTGAAFSRQVAHRAAAMAAVRPHFRRTHAYAVCMMWPVVGTHDLDDAIEWTTIVTVVYVWYRWNSGRDDLPRDGAVV